MFTTRPDTLMGVTYVVLAPEHPLVERIVARGGPESAAVAEYAKAVASKSDLDRTVAKQKSGVATGVSVAHPLTGEEVPLWVADYVLAGYGSGAVMAVPAHDERDHAFAEAFGLPIKTVVAPAGGGDAELPLTEKGVCVNSGAAFDGLDTDACGAAIVGALQEKGRGAPKVSYKLRDWVFSRQRYWGEPIPVVFPVAVAEAGGDPRKGDAHTIDYDSPQHVPEEELPVALPPLEDFEPGDDPQGCLARCLDWRFFQRDGQWWARETNTMPQWAGSCWYYLRFADPANTAEGWSAQAERDWLPVDLYVGGAEHAVLHLLYARFWHKVLHDIGAVTSAEPFQKLVHQGMILGEDGEKMSKSRGNVINPDEIVELYGGDAMRLYEMFMGPLEAVKPWQTEQISGVVRFERRVYELARRASDDVEAGEDTTRLLHQTIKKVTNDVEALGFNTAISQMMILSTHLQALDGAVPAAAVRDLALLLSPMAPHLAEECWQMLGGTASLAYEAWPEYDEALCVETTVTMGVQVNGKVRAQIEIAKDADEEAARALALAEPKVQKFLEGKEVKKFVYVPGRIVNLVAK